MIYSVVLDAVNDRFPNDGSPQSLTGVKQVFIKNPIKSDNCTVMMIVNMSDGNMLPKSITESIGFNREDTMRSLFFNLDSVGEAKASFELELVY